jgi:hypothetical protein
MHSPCGPQSTLHEPQVSSAVSAASQPSPESWLQSANPVAQTHTPAEQLWCSLHAFPQPPQLAAFDDVSASQPLTFRPSQSAVSGGHTHFPSTQPT